MAKQPRKKYRPWPKRHDGLRYVIDRDKVKELYLSNPHYSWSEFCKLEGFDPAPQKRREFPVRAWQQEYLQIQVNATEEGLMDKALDMKRLIAKNRLEFPKVWGATAEGMKSLADFILQREIINARYDQAHAEEIVMGKAKPMSTMTPAQLNFLADAQKKIQEIHQRSLLMPQAEAYKATIPIRDNDPELLEADAEDARLKALRPVLIGGGSLDSDTMTQILDRWIDQQSGKQGSDQPNDEEAIDPNSPLPPEEVE